MNFFFPSPNGVSLKKDDNQVVSYVDNSGQKRLKSFQEKRKIIPHNFFLLRGLEYFFLGFCALFETISNTGAIFDVKKQKKNEKLKLFLLICCCVLSFLYSWFFVGVLPTKISYAILGEGVYTFFTNLLNATLKVFFLSVFVLFLRVFSQFNEMLRFNAAIEKNIRKDKKRSYAVNFLHYVVFVFLFYVFVITLSGINFGVFLNFLFCMAIFAFSMGFCYEILLFNSKFSRFCLFGFLIFNFQSKTHHEVVDVAKLEMQFLQKGREFMDSDKEYAFSVVYNEVREKLSSAGVNEKSDADWIIATILGKSRSEIRLVPSVTEKQYKEIKKATNRRANGESVDNIFGFTEFFGLRFDVNKNVLTPRMETEILVEKVLDAQKEYKKCSILDIGTGSGAIAISIAKNCDAQVMAIDISKNALAVAEQNAKKNGVKVEFLHSNLFENLKRRRKFDIIVSNPPYIPSKEISKLDKNVRECDPVLALDGGDDGLEFYRIICQQAKARLKENGMIFFEVGKGQANAVKKLLKENGFEQVKSMKDYNKIERIVSGKL